MRIIALLFSFFSVVTVVRANNGDYAVSNIPASLLLNANAVVRLEQMDFNLINDGEAVYQTILAVTILNENGDRYSGFFDYYNSFRDIRSVEGNLYDASGKKIRSLKKKDIQDLSGVSEISLMEHNRIKQHNFYYKVYPYTVEYIVEVKQNGTMFYPDWNPQGAEYVAVQKSIFSIAGPQAYEFRHQAYNYDGKPTVKSEKGKNIYTWQIENLPAFVKEPYAPSISSFVPTVLVGPTAFEMEKYKGNMKSWKDFGLFMYQLISNRDQLPDNVKAKVHQLVDGLNNTEEKVKVLYNYLQTNSRYISIQLGIGGWQPFEAKFVAEKKYGDCKALTNFMLALLKEAGIKSDYALIYAGDGNEFMYKDFPSSQFNHAILCVPMQKDSIWLECTSQDVAAGYMGSFTGNRYALLVNEKGGHLVRTPSYAAQDNQQIRVINATLLPDATLQIKTKNTYTGLQQDDIHSMISSLSKDKVKEYLHDNFNLTTYDINNFDYKVQKERIPSIQETLDMTVYNYATITGKRLFITPNILTRSGSRPQANDKRKYDVYLSMPYVDIDSVTIAIPTGYKTESVPKDISLQSKFGTYSVNCKVLADKIIYYRKMQLDSGVYPAASYNELVNFYQSVYQSDRTRIVLVKEEEEKKAF